MKTATRKQSKLKGKITKVERLDTGLVVAEVEMIEGNGKLVKTHYNFRKVKGMGTADYLTWDGGKADSEMHLVNPILGSCNCEGHNNGYICRHVRMAEALRKQGKL